MNCQTKNRKGFRGCSRSLPCLFELSCHLRFRSSEEFTSFRNDLLASVLLFFGNTSNHNVVPLQCVVDYHLAVGPVLDLLMVFRYLLISAVMGIESRKEENFARYVPVQCLGFVSASLNVTWSVLSLGGSFSSVVFSIGAVDISFFVWGR